MVVLAPIGVVCINDAAAFVRRLAVRPARVHERLPGPVAHEHQAGQQLLAALGGRREVAGGAVLAQVQLLEGELLGACDLVGRGGTVAGQGGVAVWRVGRSAGAGAEENSLG